MFVSIMKPIIVVVMALVALVPGVTVDVGEQADGITKALPQAVYENAGQPCNTGESDIAKEEPTFTPEGANYPVSNDDVSMNDEIQSSKLSETEETGIGEAIRKDEESKNVINEPLNEEMLDEENISEESHDPYPELPSDIVSEYDLIHGEPIYYDDNYHYYYY